MRKHVIDTPSNHDSARMARYVDLEKRFGFRGLHPAINALRRRTRPVSQESLARAFLKIEAQQG